MGTEPQASFLIVNYKSRENVKALVSEIKSNFKGEFEILIFDCSSDLNLDDKAVKVFDVHKNLGFGKAVNYLSLQAKYNYFFILNPDVLVRGNLNTALEEFYKLKIDFAVCSLNTSEKLYTIPFFSRFTSKKRFSSHAFLIYKDYFKILGGFDPNFFMYFEDNDLALRLESFDLKTYFPKEQYVIHNQDYNFKGGLSRKVYYYKSFLYFLKKHNIFAYFVFFLPLKILILLASIVN